MFSNEKGKIEVEKKKDEKQVIRMGEKKSGSPFFRESLRP